MALNAKTLIERNMLFRGLPAKTIDRVAALATRRSYDEGEIIFMRGDPGDSLCGVVTGRVRISASRAGGKEVFLNIMEPGDAFGEIALLDGSPRTATATAMSKTELTILQREAFFGLLRGEPQLAAHLIQLSVQAGALDGGADGGFGVARPCRPRLAKRLLSLASVHGREFA